MKQLVNIVLLSLLVSWQIWTVESKGFSNGGGAMKLEDCMLGITNGYSSSMDTLSTSYDCIGGVLSSMDDMTKNDMEEATHNIVLQYSKRKVFENYMESLQTSANENTRKWATLVLEAYRTTSNAYSKFDLLQQSIERLVLSSILVQPATKWALNVGQFAAPVGILADLGEFGLKWMGYEHEGRIVGAVGNTLSGAMLGFSMGGPPGAAIGGALGFSVWMWNEFSYQRYPYINLSVLN